MRVLVTGHSGFIGSILTPLLEHTHTVHRLVSDLTDHGGVEDELQGFGPDLIIHLAAKTEVEKSFYDQVGFSEVNYVGTVNLIECAARLTNKPVILFSSTMEVYGWQPISDHIKAGTAVDIPVFDEDTPVYPNAPYAVAKLGCEKYLEYAHRSYGLEYVILRQTNTYCRLDNNFFVVEQIISQMLTADEIFLGSRLPYRNFMYISDLLDAWLVAITNIDKIKNNTFCLGPPNAVSIETLAHIIAKKIDWSGKIHWDTKPARPGEIYCLNSSHSKFSQLTGWIPKISLSTGLDLTIAHWNQVVNC